MKIEKISYTETYSIGITPDCPSGKHLVEKQYNRESYGVDGKTPYKEAVANALFLKYVDYGDSEDSFRKEYENSLAKVYLAQRRGGCSWNITQEKWLQIMEGVHNTVDKMSTVLWDKYHAD